MFMNSLKKIFVVRKEDNAEFWVGHTIILISTVVGVYLAATLGFEQAWKFEENRINRQSYFLRNALLDELKDNVNSAEAWTQQYLNGGSLQFEGARNEVTLDNFVWESLKESPQLHEIPAPILRNVARFYGDASTNLGRIAEGGQFAQPAAEFLMGEIKKARETLIPVIEKNITELKAQLVQRGVTIE